MARRRGDHDARRRDVADAVVRVLIASGFHGLTLRAVATELGATTGVVTHYFATKGELQAFTLDLLERSVDERPRPALAPGLPALRATVLAMLPLTEPAMVANRVWISSWDVVLADADLTERYAAIYRRSRARLQRLVRQAQGLGQVAEGDARHLAAAIHAFTLGLSVQAVLDPGAFPPGRQTAMVDAYLGPLVGGRGADRT